MITWKNVLLCALGAALSQLFEHPTLINLIGTIIVGLVLGWVGVTEDNKENRS